MKKNSPKRISRGRFPALFRGDSHLKPRGETTPRLFSGGKQHVVDVHHNELRGAAMRKFSRGRHTRGAFFLTRAVTPPKHTRCSSLSGRRTLSRPEKTPRLAAPPAKKHSAGSATNPLSRTLSLLNKTKQSLSPSVHKSKPPTPHSIRPPTQNPPVIT